MGEAINCNYAHVAVRMFSQKYRDKKGSRKLFSPTAVQKITDEYNQHFSENSNMHLTCVLVAKKAPVVLSNFNQRWHPKEERQAFLDTFSITKWNELEASAKQRHQLRNCTACQNDHSELYKAFPNRSYTKIKQVQTQPSISFTAEDLSSPRKLGGKCYQN